MLLVLSVTAEILAEGDASVVIDIIIGSIETRSVPPAEDGPAEGRRMAVEGKVAKVLGSNEIVLNRGRNDGVRTGMVFEVFSPEGEEVWDPDTGETLGTVEDVKAQAEVTEVKDRLSVARLRQTANAPFGAVDIGEMQENLQRMFGQMFGDDVRIQGFGAGSPDDPDLESMLGGPLQDLSKVQVGDAAREVKRR
jgi:hypothetical protein